MPDRNAMTDRATVERATTVTDAIGQPGPPTWATHISSLACRYWTTDEREVVNGQIVGSFAGTRMIVPLAADITELDRVTAIKDRKGATLVGNTMQIRAVIRRRDHKEIRLVEVN